MKDILTSYLDDKSGRWDMTAEEFYSLYAPEYHLLNKLTTIMDNYWKDEEEDLYE